MNPTFAAIGGRSMWYLTRGSGVVALLFLTASVALGLLTSVRWESRRWPRFVVEGLHRNISLAVVVFLGIHIATTVVDGFVPIRWLDVIVPFGAGYRPVWVGLGALAVDCLLAIVVTSLLRVRIGPRIWRLVHWLAYACWPIALVHAMGTGSDTTEAWMLAIDGISVLVVLAMLWWRLAARRPLRAGAAPIALAASLALCVCIGLFAWRGPLAQGWGSHGARLGADAAPITQFALPIDAKVSGSRTVADSEGARVVTLVASTTATAAPAISLDIALSGAPDPSGGVAFRNGSARLTIAGGADWSGPVTTLRGAAISADLTGPKGERATMIAEVTIDRRAQTLTGTVHVGTAPGQGAR